jgi:hypothetical protein
MSQYAIAKNPSQEDQQMAEQVAQQMQRFVQPLLAILDAYVDCRLVETFWRTMVAIMVARTSPARVGAGGISGRPAARAGRNQTPQSLVALSQVVQWVD